MTDDVTFDPARVPARALAIVAHPDDAEFNCGATFARWSAAGCECSHLVLTDGSKGTWDPDQDRQALIDLRQREQRAAAAALGATGTVAFGGWVDGELEADLARRSAVARRIRELRPEVVLAHDPWQRWRLHPDHRAAGFLACDGVVAARDPHFHPEHGVPHHRPEHLLLFETEEPDVAVDVSGHGEAKVAALLAHESQFETTMEIDEIDDGGQREAFRRRILDELSETGARHGLAQAEAFRALRP